MYYNTLVEVVSMDVEAIAVIKKNSKNNNTKGCEYSAIYHDMDKRFCYAINKDLFVIRVQVKKR